MQGVSLSHCNAMWQQGCLSPTKQGFVAAARLSLRGLSWWALLAPMQARLAGSKALSLHHCIKQGFGGTQCVFFRYHRCGFVRLASFVIFGVASTFIWLASLSLLWLLSLRPRDHSLATISALLFIANIGLASFVGFVRLIRSFGFVSNSLSSAGYDHRRGFAFVRLASFVWLCTFLSENGKLHESD